MKLQSQQHLNINFNPASLLSVGDALAFWTLLSGGPASTPPPGSESGSVSDFIAASPENIPELGEQMAQTGSITSRVPQKYLIQNQSGLGAYYWSSEVLWICTVWAVYSQCE